MQDKPQNFLGYFAIVVKVPDEGGKHHWEIQEDSSHLFDDVGGGYSHQEIVISGISRTLNASPPSELE